MGDAALVKDGADPKLAPPPNEGLDPKPPIVEVLPKPEVLLLPNAGAPPNAEVPPNPGISYQ